MATLFVEDRITMRDLPDTILSGDYVITDSCYYHICHRDWRINKDGGYSLELVAQIWEQF